MATPVEALRQECGLTSFETDMMRTIGKSAEKAERLPADHPRKLDNNRRRLCRDNWRSMAKDLQRQLPMEMRERVAITHFDHEPWMEAKCLDIEPKLEGVTSRLEPESVKKEASLRRIRQIGGGEGSGTELADKKSIQDARPGQENSPGGWRKPPVTTTTTFESMVGAPCGDSWELALVSCGSTQTTGL